jgi:hypothetical protein
MIRIVNGTPKAAGMSARCPNMSLVLHYVAAISGCLASPGTLLWLLAQSCMSHRGVNAQHAQICCPCTTPEEAEVGGRTSQNCSSACSNPASWDTKNWVRHCAACCVQSPGHVVHSDVSRHGRTVMQPVPTHAWFVSLVCLNSGLGC